MGPSGHFYSHVGTCYILGRAPPKKETLPDFREWCQATRHPRVFHGLTG